MKINKNIILIKGRSYMQLRDVVTYKNKKKLFVVTFIFNVCGVKEYEVTIVF